MNQFALFLSSCRQALNAILLIGLGIGFGTIMGCQDDPPRTSAETCEGKGTVTVGPDGKRTIGALNCAGVCPDGARCRPVQNAAGTREWCGCPGEAEPKDCHLVKVKLSTGDWAFDCDGPCPQPQDMCTPQSVRQPPNQIVVSCECLTPGEGE